MCNTSAAAGCTFANFDGYNALFVGSGATAAFVNCTFAENALSVASSGTAVLEADAAVDFPDTEVWLQVRSSGHRAAHTIRSIQVRSLHIVPTTKWFMHRLHMCEGCFCYLICA